MYKISCSYLLINICMRYLVLFLLYWLVKGSYRDINPFGLEKLRKEFWSEGLNNPPHLDETQYWLVQELPDGTYQIINGNHRRTLLLTTPGSPKTWPCRIIPKEEVSFIHLFSYLFRNCLLQNSENLLSSQMMIMIPDQSMPHTLRDWSMWQMFWTNTPQQMAG